MNNETLRFINQEQLDRMKWNGCIARSSTPRVYAEAWYLDLVSPGWTSLVYGDYAHVMPLTVSQKFGISFLLQPIFAQQLGIFPEAPEHIQASFLHAVARRFRYAAIQMNTSCSGVFSEVFSAERRLNLVLDLAVSYQNLRENYSSHTIRKIRKAEKQGVFVVKGLSPNDYIDLKDRANASRLPVKPMQTLKRIISNTVANGMGVIYSAYTPDNSLCAAAFFLRSGKQIVYLNAVSTDEGKQTNAMHLLVDRFIRDHAGKSLWLDFEGSSIEGIARFYEGFGAQPEYYISLKMNRFPAVLRWLIR